MKLAVQNPMFSGMSGLHGWIAEFLRLYAPAIYVSDVRYLPQLAYFFIHHRLNPVRHQLLFSERELNASADVLLCFNGHPYRKESRPVKSFAGLKIYHVMDYTYYPEASNKALMDGGVDYVFGYNRHDTYCDFFKAKYPGFIGKVIPVPFGFAERFHNTTPFRERTPKVVALGSVNAFAGPVHDTPEFQEVNEFFSKRGEKFMHKFRRMLVEHEGQLQDFMDSKLPHYPQTKDFGYDLVATCNAYQMFVSCESLQYFPPAKAFEGPASGCVMVCSDHPCYRDLGFQDGVNCITHQEFDLGSFREKVLHYLRSPEELERIQQEGMRFVRQNYNHQAVAKNLYGSIETRWKGTRAPSRKRDAHQ